MVPFGFLDFTFEFSRVGAFTPCASSWNSMLPATVQRIILTRDFSAIRVSFLSLRSQLSLITRQTNHEHSKGRAHNYRYPPRNTKQYRNSFKMEVGGTLQLERMSLADDRELYVASC